jgi:hypothetical protein
VPTRDRPLGPVLIVGTDRYRGHSDVGELVDEPIELS